MVFRHVLVRKMSNCVVVLVVEEVGNVCAECVRHGMGWDSWEETEEWRIGDESEAMIYDDAQYRQDVWF